jgi:hypothetical protein
MTTREMGILAATGFAIWLSGAVMFRFGGALLFENGPAILLISGAAIALSVCGLLSAVMGWRKQPASRAVEVAVAMAIPGLFADAAYVAWFAPLTGMHPETAGPFAAVILFGNAALLAWATIIASRAPARAA